MGVRGVGPELTVSEADFLLKGLLGCISRALLGQGLIAGCLEIYPASCVDAMIIPIAIVMDMPMRPVLLVVVDAAVLISTRAVTRCVSRSRMSFAQGLVRPAPIIEGITVFGSCRHSACSEE